MKVCFACFAPWPFSCSCQLLQMHPQPVCDKSKKRRRDGGEDWGGTPNSQWSPSVCHLTLSRHSLDVRYGIIGSSIEADQLSFNYHWRRCTLRLPCKTNSSNNAMKPRNCCHVLASGTGSRRNFCGKFRNWRPCSPKGRPCLKWCLSAFQDIDPFACLL